MTLSEKIKAFRKRLCGQQGRCGLEIERGLSDALSSSDEILVFRRDISTGRYKMSTACCEAILPPIQ